MAQATGKPDRNDSLLDEFSEVHGTVLLGMHKALQTLKQEIEQRTEERIDSFQSRLDTASEQIDRTARQTEAVFEKAITHSEALLNTIAHTSKLTATEIATEKSSLLAEFALLREQITQDRSALQSEAESARTHFASVHEDFQTKLTAALSYTNRLNTESQSLLKTIKERQKQLNLREQALHRRTRRHLIGSTLVATLAAMAATGLWLWLTQRI